MVDSVQAGIDAHVKLMQQGKIGADGIAHNEPFVVAEDATGYQSSDSMDEEVLRQLVQDLWDVIAALRTEQPVWADTYAEKLHALKERVIEALNLDE